MDEVEWCRLMASVDDVGLTEPLAVDGTTEIVLWWEGILERDDDGGDDDD